MKKGIVFGVGFLVLIWLIMFRAEASASFKACETGGTPTDGEYVPTTVQAERNRLEAAIQDWREDLALATKNKKIVCLAGSVEWVMYSTEASKFLEGYNEDIRYLKLQLSSNEVMLPRILRQMALSSEELDAYQALQIKEQEIASCAMEVRSAISSRLFLMSVLQRIYKSQIDYHSVQMGQKKDFQESCVIREKRIERDRALIEAGNRLLPWYDILEKAN
jgi:hypothetical protein